MNNRRTMRSRIFAVLAIALLAGGGLAAGTYHFPQTPPAAAGGGLPPAPYTSMRTQPFKQVNTPTQPVVVAAGDLQLGAEIKKEDLQVVQFPAGQTPEGAFAKGDEGI